MTAIARLLDVMTKLRDPETGCPWDVAQSFTTIAPYSIEEAYEVAEAIAEQDWPALEDELGDLLFQVVFHAEMAREAGLFDFEAVAHGVAEKMVRRHPHVFGDGRVANAEAQTHAWEAQKTAERAAKAEAEDRPASVLDGVATALPALTRAKKLQARAARIGFDWPVTAAVIDKIDEEIEELRAEFDDGADKDRIMDEIGDLLFACVNLARHAGIDPESALRQGNAKFERRFRRIEAMLEETGSKADQSSLEEMDRLWDAVKAEERDQSD